MPKYKVRFFHDWGSGTWLWSDNEVAKRGFGYAIDHAAIGLPEALVAELDHLAEWHDTALNWEYPPDPGPWREPQCEAFNDAARRTLVQLRSALGSDWLIVEEFKPLHEDPDLDRYLAAPHTFWR